MPGQVGQVQGQPRVAPETTNVREGHLGQHRVSLGQQPPFRLDEIGTERISFQGFRKATRIERATQGAQQQVKNLVSTLIGSVHTVDAPGMLKSLNTLENYLGRLTKLGALFENDYEKTVLAMLAPQVESLDNASLQSLYSTLVSRDMNILRQAMEQEAHAAPEQKAQMMGHLSLLMDLEALVVSEVSRRVASCNMTQAERTLMPTLTETHGNWYDAPVREENEHDMGNQMLGAMVETTAATARRADADAARIDAFRANYPKLPEVSPREIGNILRSAELTINLDANVLFGATSDAFPIGNPDFSLQNMFTRRELGADVDPEYAQLRERVEDLLLPQLHGHTEGRERPLYGALNVTGSIKGGAGAGSYGNAVVVLKESVKKQATYTLNDTFVMPTIRISPDKENAFLAKVQELGDILMPETVEALADEASDLRQAIHTLFTEHAGSYQLLAVEQEKMQAVFEGIKVVHGEKNAMSQEMRKDLMLQVCADAEQTRQAVTTFDNLENVFGQMNFDTQVSMFRSLREAKKGRIALTGADYVEAQIGKAVTLEDIAEIRLPDWTFEHDAEKQRLVEAWSQRTGVKVTFVSDQQVSNCGAERFKRIISHHQYANELRESEIRPLLAPACEQVLNEWVEQYAAQKPGLNEILPHVEPGPFLRDRARVALSGKLRHHAEISWKDWGPDQHHITSGLTDVARKFVDQKLELLKVANQYEFETEAQKSFFMNWVLKAGNIRNVDEMRMVYEGAMNFRKSAEEWYDAGLSGRDIVKKMVERQHMHREMINRFVGKLENGSDDNAAHTRRFAFMGVNMLKLALAPEKFAEVKSLLDCREMRMFNAARKAFMGEILSPRITAKWTGQKLNDQGQQEAVGTVNVRGCEEMSCLRLMDTYEVDMEFSLERKTTNTDYMKPAELPTEYRSIFLEQFPELRAVVDAMIPPAQHLAVERPAMPTAPASLTALGPAGRRDFLVRCCLPRYREHERTFDAGTEFHGRTHATRTFIFAQVLGNILREKHVDVNVDALALAAAGHDIGRQKNGDDLDEARSADITAQLVAADHELSAEFSQAFKECITSKMDTARTLEAWLLHCADSLDYGRVGVFDPGRFPFYKESIMQEGMVMIPTNKERLLTGLAKEANMLATMTHPQASMRTIADDLLLQAGTDSKKMDQYRELKKMCADMTMLRTEKESDEEVVTRIETVIRNNPQTFPLLTKYYLSQFN